TKRKHLSAQAIQYIKNIEPILVSYNSKSSLKMEKMENADSLYNQILKKSKKKKKLESNTKPLH
ncbi:hypothetical protein ACJX0J_031620, partial [Zea mays]